MADRQSASHVKTEAESSESSESLILQDDQLKVRRGITVSRPPSTHITRVDEEPSSTDKHKPSSHSESIAIETVDRGVGPTPVPPHNVDHRALPYVGMSPYAADPRNGMLESPYAGLAFPYHVPYPINQPLPLNCHTLEGRYHWPPSSPFHQPAGLASSPAHSDVSLINMPSPLGLESVTHLASRIHWEQLRRNFYYPIHGRRPSPGSLPGLPLAGSIAGDYPIPSGLSGQGMFDIPPTPGSGSITLPGSLESSRLTSPRPSVIGKSRKRIHPHSPISDYLDIQSLTRSSEGSLQLTPYLHNSRSSSAASGSYGHLSAASYGAVSPAYPVPPNPYFRPGANIPGSPYIYPMIHHGYGRPQTMGQMAPPGGPQMLPPKLEPQDRYIHPQVGKEAGSSIVSSTVEPNPNIDMKRTKVKKEMDHTTSAFCHPMKDELDDEDEKPNGDPGQFGHMPQEGEPDFIETNCHWEECRVEYDTQDDLVKHINQDHIQASKKSFVCRWNECSREGKPFKAQYMLVVHMRRHTGEKPHRCTFEGCNKAYSRLENLKTHLRSHTGEKPYMCEFPSCSKAFSNASDRAKHQNRTHSNAKPYICKAIGCTKRYTDPSSLRKHVKTVHGPDFYANKKHKGNEPGCNSHKGDHEQEKDRNDDDTNKKVEECLTVTPLHASNIGERRKSQDSSGAAITTQSHPSPQSSPEVNVTNVCQPEVIEEHIGGSQVTSTIGSLAVEEEVDIPDADEAEIPGSHVSLLTRSSNNRAFQNRAVKGCLSKKTPSMSILPQIPIINTGSNVVRGNTTQPSLTDLSSKVTQIKNTAPQQKRIIDLNGRQDLLYGQGRRDSNTSTISSYMSSMRSDASPYPFGSQMSSRRSSETSQIHQRMSITNSPYEYDITGNLPHYSRRSSESSNFGNMSNRLQKTKIGSYPNLVVQSQAMPLRSPSSKYTNERLAHFFAARNDLDGARTSTPCYTPLPSDMPNREVRRASDPVRTLDRNFVALKRLQRFHSLNMVRPLPMPLNMKSLQGKAGSNNTFHSSRSSIATDYSLIEDPEYGSPPGMNDSLGMETDHEAALEERMLEDNEDMIIPDDMQRFLNERYGNQFPKDNLEYNQNRMGNMNYSQSQSAYNQMVQLTNQANNNNLQQNFDNLQIQPGFHGNQEFNSNIMAQNQNGSQSNKQNNIGAQSQVGGQANKLSNVETQNQVERQSNRNANMAAQNQAESQGNRMNMVGQMQTTNQFNRNGNTGPQLNSANQYPMQQQQNMQMWNDGGQNNQQQPMVDQQQRGPTNQMQANGMQSQMSPNMVVPQTSQQAAMMQQGINQWQMMQQMSGNQGNNTTNPMLFNPKPPSIRKLQQQQGGLMQKPERSSPQVQVPHISQSQIPPRAKAANRSQLLRQQQMMQQQMANQQSFPVNNQSNNYPMPVGTYSQNVPSQNGINQQPLPPQQNGYQQQPMNQSAAGYNQSMDANTNGMGYPIGQLPGQQLSPYSNNTMERSPGCNQVTSSTDRKETTAPPIEDFMENLTSISTENLIDNISSISTENLNNTAMYSPTGQMNRSASQTSSRFSIPIANTNNMVINDMSSVLTQLAEENRCLNMRP